MKIDEQKRKEYDDDDDVIQQIPTHNHVRLADIAPLLRSSIVPVKEVMAQYLSAKSFPA